MKFAAKNALLALGISFLCLLALEGLSRLILDDGKLYELEMWKYAREIKVRDPAAELGHRHRPQAEAELMGVTIRTNSRGFRSPEIAEKAEPGVARIAFVGNSITLGWGVAEHETFARRIVDALVNSGHKVEAFNLGVGNYNTSQELALFRDAGAGLKPDIIVLCYFINDAEPMPQYSSGDWLSEHSAAWVVFRYRVDSLLRKFGESPGLEALLSRALPARCRRLGADQECPLPLRRDGARSRRRARRLPYSRAARIEALSVRRRHGTDPHGRRKRARAFCRPPANGRGP